ncbi:hypothetical protein Angca_003250 [Angiostrongylus cantonensis]|nr:hypothetical protein Angca_003250 [Angiostrongylus cantonensis]
MANRVLRPRQTSTAAVVSQTPLKHAMSETVVGRRSLPRSAKVQAEHEGYKSQLFSPDERHVVRKKSNEMTPAAKISQKIASVLTIESPESHSNSRRSLSGTRRRETAYRSLDFSQSVKKTQCEPLFESMEIEHDENVPPIGDTVGRRLQRTTVKPIPSDSQVSIRTPLKMKITKSGNNARVSSSTVKSRSSSATKLRCTRAPDDAEILPITVRFRSVLQRNDGSLEYRTVGSESPWGMKRPVARIIPARLKLSKLDLETEQDSPFSVNECEKSSLSEDYSSDDSDEIDDSLLYSDEKLDIISNQRRKSSSRKSILFKTTTPFVSSKPRNGLQKTKKDKGKVGMLENLRLRLHTADVPERMPCREEESQEVERFILDAISTHGTSSAMYISGVPGTGKTATVMSVVKQLSRNKSCNKFTFVAVNAMELIDPKTIFVGIYNQIVDKPIRISPQAARRKLNTMFEAADKHRPPIVILVDELDQLCTKKQELIYDIFNWTSVELARVSVIAIANTLDLPERMLSQRVTSRIGAARICFQPYEFQQIEHIIHDKLKESVNTVEVEAIQFAARKVAAVTGDLRKAMDVLRHAIEIAIEKGSKRLLVEHVLCATREASSTLLVHFVKGLSKHALLLFRSAVFLAEKTEDFTFAELHAQYISYAALIEGIEPLVESTLLSLVGQLCSIRLLVSSKGSHILRRRIRLGMSYQDAQSAIRIRENADKKIY